MRRVGQARVVPAEVFLPARVGGGHHVAGVGGEVEERMLEDLAGVVAGGELRHGVMHVLVLLVLQLQRHDGQAVEKEDEINLLVGLAEVEMRAEGDAVLAVFLGGGALGGAGLGIEEPELQPAHLQPVAQEHPERRVLQFLAQRLEHLVPRVRAVVVRQFLERVGLRGFEEGPEMVLGDAMLGVRDVGLFEHAILVLADEEVRDVLLKGQLRGLLARHGRLPPFLVAAELVEFASRTVAPQAGQRNRSRDSSSKRSPVSSSSDSGRHVKRNPLAATFSISPQTGHSNNSRSLANNPKALAFACKAAISVASARIFAMPRFMISRACVSPGRERATPRPGRLAPHLRIQAPRATRALNTLATRRSMLKEWPS